MPTAKKYKKEVERPEKHPTNPKVAEEVGTVDEQVSTIYGLLERNHGRILDLHDKLGGPYPRGQGEVPDDMDQVITAVLDHIISRLSAQEDTIEGIHENISNKIGRIKLY